MASGWYNRGKMLVLQHATEQTAAPVNFYAPLLLATYTPDPDHATWAALSANEIAAGDGYTTGGEAIPSSASGFDAPSQNDGSDYGQIQLADVVYTVSGTSIPASGSGARYMAMTDDNATQANRQLYMYFDLVSDQSSTVSITLEDFIARLT